MKRFVAIFAIALLASTLSFAQKKVVKPKLFTIQGQLSNCTAKQARLMFYDKNGGHISELANIDEQGRFYLTCAKVTSPVLASIQSDAFYFWIYVAPGYNLTLTADCKNRSTIIQTKDINGYGATWTQYLFTYDKVAPKITQNWFELNSVDLLVYLKTRKRLCDSIYHAITSKALSPERFYSFFRKKTLLDIKFFALDAVTMCTARDTTMSFKQSLEFVNKNSDHSLLQNLYKKEYLISDAYITFMEGGYYNYLWSLKRKRDLTLDNKMYYNDCLKLITSNYKGEIKYKTLNYFLQNAVRFARSFEELNLYKKQFPRYIAQLTKPSQKKEIEKLLDNKEKELFKTQIGRPAPLFTAIDSSGTSFDLANFKGKVVLLDLWASWCVPCRQLTPYLKTLMSKYDSQANLAFISIAVNDKIENWKKAMAEDKPIWLQLFDNNSIVNRSFVANSIPKLVVIDKKGNIVTFDAPMSNSMDELKKILDNELSK